MHGGFKPAAQSPPSRPDPVYSRLCTARPSGRHISFSSRLALTISGRAWPSDVMPTSLIAVANSSARTVTAELLVFCTKSSHVGGV